MGIFNIGAHIEERSKLVFVYYTNNYKQVRVMDFFENIKVTESQKSNLVKYNPLGRSSSLFAYTGSPSRELKLSFNITLPNILRVAQFNNKRYATKSSKEDLQAKFFDKLSGNVLGQDISNIEENSKRYQEQYKSVLDSEETSLLNKYIFAKSSPLYNENNLKDKAIDTIIYWTNLIRSSVINNASNPLEGIPIVRLIHGTLYRDIPCVCNSYHIEANDAAGMDKETLLPRKIVVSMNLSEVRTGDFSSFEYGHKIKRDNIAGWEAILSKPFSKEPGGLERL